jgi:hypothetical protein
MSGSCWLESVSRPLIGPASGGNGELMCLPAKLLRVRGEGRQTESGRSAVNFPDFSEKIACLENHGAHFPGFLSQFRGSQQSEWPGVL